MGQMVGDRRPPGATILGRRASLCTSSANHCIPGPPTGSVHRDGSFCGQRARWLVQNSQTGATLRRHFLRAVAAAVPSSTSLWRLRLRVAAQACGTSLSGVSATPGVEAPRISCCRGSRVSLTFVHVVAATLLLTAASRVRTSSYIFPCGCCRNIIRLRACAFGCHTAKLADPPSCAGRKCPNPTRVSHLWCGVPFSDVPTTTHRSVWLAVHRLSLLPHPDWQGPGNIVERTPLPQEEILLFSCSFSWSVHFPIARHRSRSHGLP